MHYLRLLTAWLLCWLPMPAAAQPAPPGLMTGVAITGEAGTYHVRSGDSLTLIAARLGASLAQLQRENFPPGSTDKANALRPGQALVYDNRHIVPPAPVAEGDALVINLPQRMLFHFRDGGLRAARPVAVGKRDWQTPVTATRIATREKDKDWIVPVSIQAEMRAKGQPVLTRVPAGPENPLGRYWMGLELPGYGIHGTNAPASVYGVRTHGCIRLQPEHIEALFADVTVGTPVWTIYTPVLIYLPSDGAIWLEVHPDAYARRLDYPRLLQTAVDAAGVTERVDRAAAESQLKKQDGIARNVAVALPAGGTTINGPGNRAAHHANPIATPRTEPVAAEISANAALSARVATAVQHANVYRYPYGAPDDIRNDPDRKDTDRKDNDERKAHDLFPPHPAGCFPGRDRCAGAAGAVACR